MRYSTDDEVYRVNSVWIGLPNATFPWRARYVSWFIGFALFLVIFAIARQMFDLSFWTIAFSLVITVFLTQRIGRLIDPERPLLQVLVMAGHEVRTPRRPDGLVGGAASAASVRVRPDRPRRATPHPPAAPTPEVHHG